MPDLTRKEVIELLAGSSIKHPLFGLDILFSFKVGQRLDLSDQAKYLRVG